MASISGQPG